MKKNKLIPLLSAVALSSAAPIAMMTSCVDRGIQMVDVTNGYTFDQPIYDKNVYLNQNTATQAFIDEVGKNPNLFRAELYSSYYRYYSNMALEMGGFIKSAKVGVSNPKIEFVTVCYPGEEPVTYPVISFKMKYDVEFISSSTTKYGYKNENRKYAGENEYSKVPFYAYETLPLKEIYDKELKLSNDNGYKSHWTIGMLDAVKNNSYILNFFRGWEIKTSFDFTSQKTEFEPETGKQTKTEKQSFSKKFNSFDQIQKIVESKQGEMIISSISSFDFDSTYLCNAKSVPTVFGNNVKFSITGVDDETAKNPTVAEIIGMYVAITPEMSAMIDLIDRDPNGQFSQSSAKQQAFDKLFNIDFGTDVSGDPIMPKFEATYIDEDGTTHKYLAQYVSASIDFERGLSTRVGGLTRAMPLKFEVEFLKEDLPEGYEILQAGDKSRYVSLNFDKKYNVNINWADNWRDYIYYPESTSIVLKQYNEPISLYPNKDFFQFLVPASGIKTGNLSEYFDITADAVSQYSYFQTMRFPGSGGSEPARYHIALSIPLNSTYFYGNPFITDYEQTDVINEVKDVSISYKRSDAETTIIRTADKITDAIVAWEADKETGNLTMIKLEFDVLDYDPWLRFSSDGKFDIPALGDLSLVYTDTDGEQRMAKLAIPKLEGVTLEEVGYSESYGEGEAAEEAKPAPWDPNPTPIVEK